MRIAIIGNMNNGGFSIMRYFRDLGADAWLLPYATDGIGQLAHFEPEADTWDPAKWGEFIRPFPIPNSAQAIIGEPAALRRPPPKKGIEAALRGYDRFIGSGVAPALFERIGRRLDIFFPYSIGIEFYGTAEFRARMAASSVRRLMHGRVRRMQAQGIRNARHCLNAEMSLTRSSFEEIGKPFAHLGIPAVYNGEDRRPAEAPPRLREALRRIAQADLSLFGAARQMWVRDAAIPEDEWPSCTKNSDWLIRGAAAFLAAHPDVKLLLTLVAYGPDEDASRRLIAELGLEDHVQWLPVMPRREIMLLLEASDIGVGEFYTAPGLLWGGTGWETLASGRPLLQAFNFTKEGYESAFGHAPPPLLDVRSADDVARQLALVASMADKGRSIGAESAIWFDRHGGIGLARRWLELIAPAAEAAR